MWKSLAHGSFSRHVALCVAGASVVTLPIEHLYLPLLFSLLPTPAQIYSLIASIFFLHKLFQQ